MAQKRYQLSANAVASPYYDAGWTVRFRYGEEGGTRVVAAHSQEVTILSTDVMGVTNEVAQRMIDNTVIPKGIKVNGVHFDPNYGSVVFTDVTSTTVGGDVTLNLDAQLARRAGY
jgi:hypothetical protein